MRSFVIAAVMTLLVAGLGLAIGTPRPPSPASAASAAGRPNADAAVPSESLLAVDSSDGGESEASAAGDTRAPAAGGKRVFYQWTDERGSVRFAQSLADVPPAWRDRAGQVEVDTSKFQATPARPRASADGAAARPFAQAAVAERRRAFHDVTVYTAPWCGWCRKTLAFLDQRGVDYVNKDIEADAEYADELAEKSGGKTIPFVEIDGTQIRGYNPREMAALLE
jgi:mycoredoxin